MNYGGKLCMSVLFNYVIFAAAILLIANQL